MICAKCGNQLNDGAAFCPKCGNRVVNNIANNVVNQPIVNNAAVNPAAAQSAVNQPIVNNAAVNPAAAQSAVNQPIVNNAAVNPAAAQNMVNRPMMNNAAINPAAVGSVKKKSKTWMVVLITVVATVVAGFAGLLALGSRSSVTDTRSAVTSEDVLDTQPEEALDIPATSDDEAVSELLGYIDQAEELVLKSLDVESMEDEEDLTAEMIREEAAVIEDVIADLEGLQKQADAIGGIDAKLKNAQKEYFNMVCSSERTYLEIWTFFADFIDLAYVLDAKPTTGNYSSIEDYYNDLYMWYSSAKDGYSAIKCPSCLESEWKQLDNILDLNESVVEKLYDAVQYEDFLRFFSAMYMADRYDTVIELLAGELIEGSLSETEFCMDQMLLPFDLAEEMHNYAELEEGEREAFAFENIYTGDVDFSYDTVDTIYPSLYNTYDAFLIIKTGCKSGSRNIVVEAEIPGFTQTYKESFTLDAGYKTIYVKPPALTGDLGLSSAKDAQMSLTISEQDGTLIQAKTFPVTIKSKYDVEWYTDEYGIATKDNILCFLTPEAAAISKLKRQAIEEISSITGGEMESFVGYQDNPYDDVSVGTYLQAAGIMRALFESGVRYNNDTFSLSGSNQHILYPEDVLEQQSGLCIETSLVVASALQSANMHAFLVLPPGHAQVAVEIWPGTGEYFLIETTCLDNKTNSQNLVVYYAQQLLDEGYIDSNAYPISYLTKEEWLDYLSVDGTYLIDCDDSNVLGLTSFAN